MAKQIDLKALLESKVGNLEPDKGVQKAIEKAEISIPKNLVFDMESTEFKPETKPVTSSGVRRLTVEEAKLFDDEMNRFIDAVLIPNIDYGLIPNCKKPTLLKSGAEKILNYLQLIARVCISNRVEDYNENFFSYEVIIHLLDYNGVVKGEGVGIANTREAKYAKSSGYAVQNTVLKMAKKRAFVDATLNVGNLSARFTQDVENMNLEYDIYEGKNPEELKKPSKTPRLATNKQIQYLEQLMQQHGNTPETMNRYVKQAYGIDNYTKVTAVQISELIEKYKAIEPMSFR